MILCAFIRYNVAQHLACLSSAFSCAVPCICSMRFCGRIRLFGMGICLLGVDMGRYCARLLRSVIALILRRGLIF